MSKLVWDQIGQKTYETGVDKGVLFVANASGYDAGVAWNGLTNVTESPDGAEATKLYANNKIYGNLLSKENEKIKIEAYTYPKEFAACNGEVEVKTGVSIGQQSRKSFCLAYRTKIGNDLSGTDYGYKLHIIYGLFASPSEKAYSTINNDPEAIMFSWSADATPVEVSGHEETASVIIDSTTTADNVMKAIEDAIYGTDSEDSKLLMPDEIVALVG